MDTSEQAALGAAANTRPAKMSAAETQPSPEGGASHSQQIRIRQISEPTMATVRIPPADSRTRV